MYESKRTHAPSVYASDHDPYSHERLALIAELRRALANADELVVYYQPQADIATGTVRGVEALVRWNHPERGLLRPDQIHPAGGTHRPDRRRHSTSSTRRFGSAASGGVRGSTFWLRSTSVARDLLDLHFPEEVKRLLAKWGVEAVAARARDHRGDDPDRPPARVHRPATAQRAQAYGSRSTISAAAALLLGYLKRLPIDTLKIDKSFVLNMADDRDDAAIVRSTIELGQTSGWKSSPRASRSRAWPTIWRQPAATCCRATTSRHRGRHRASIPAAGHGLGVAPPADLPERQRPPDPDVGSQRLQPAGAQRARATGRRASNASLVACRARRTGRARAPRRGSTARRRRSTSPSRTTQRPPTIVESTATVVDPKTTCWSGSLSGVKTRLQIEQDEIGARAGLDASRARRVARGLRAARASPSPTPRAAPSHSLVVDLPELVQEPGDLQRRVHVVAVVRRTCRRCRARR